MDVREQTCRCIERIGMLVSQAGGSLESVVKTTCFLADIGDFERVQRRVRGGVRGACAGALDDPGRPLPRRACSSRSKRSPWSRREHSDPRWHGRVGRDTTRADVLVEEGVISAIGRLGPVAGAEMIDATERWVMPGGVDPHVHFETPSAGIVTATRSPPARSPPRTAARRPRCTSACRTPASRSQRRSSAGTENSIATRR